MGNVNGPTAAVMAALSPTAWMVRSEIAAAVPFEFRAHVGTIVSQKVSAGAVIRKGERRAYRYKLVSATETTSVVAPRQQMNLPRRGGMHNAPETFTASLGTVCRMTAPANKPEGTIEQALEAVLALREALTLDEILVALTIGWSRAEALSALTEGVHGERVVSANSGGRTCYRLACTPPAEREDSTAVDITAVTAAAIALPPVSVARFRDRVDFMRMNLRVLLKDGCSENVPRALLQHLAEAGTAIEKAHRSLTTQI